MTSALASPCSNLHLQHSSHHLTSYCRVPCLHSARLAIAHSPSRVCPLPAPRLTSKARRHASGSTSSIDVSGIFLATDRCAGGSAGWADTSSAGTLSSFVGSRRQLLTSLGAVLVLPIAAATAAPAIAPAVAPESNIAAAFTAAPSASATSSPESVARATTAAAEASGLVPAVPASPSTVSNTPGPFPERVRAGSGTGTGSGSGTGSAGVGKGLASDTLAGAYVVPALTVQQYLAKIDAAIPQAWLNFSILLDQAKFKQISEALFLPPFDDIKQSCFYIPWALLRTDTNKAVAARLAYNTVYERIVQLDKVALSASRYVAEESEVDTALRGLQTAVADFVQVVRA